MAVTLEGPWFRLRAALSFAALLIALLVPTLALAGEVKFGTEPLPIDESGKLTSAGREAALTKVESEPGEETWLVHLWAKLDNGAPGPLYVEFFGKLPDGKPYRAYQYEHTEYDGEPYVSFPMELSGNDGFNKGRAYTVKVTQVSAKNKDLVLATGRIELEYRDAEAEAEGGADEADEEAEGEPEKDPEMSAQDELDSLGDGAGQEGPPPVDSKGKKGCSVQPASQGLASVLACFVLGLGLTRRRRI